MNIVGQKFKIIVMSLGLVFLVNQLAAQLFTVSDNKSHSIETTKGKFKSTSVSFGGLKSFNIEYRGDIEVNDTDTDVIGISRGGYLEISKTTFGSKRSIVFESKEGKLVKEYYEGRRKIDYVPDGEEWLAEILPDIVRSTGIAAESRLNRFYKQGGVNSVMSEIARLESSYVQNIYGKLLLRKDDLTNSELSASIKELAREMDSDYYKAELLSDASKKYLSNDELTIAFFDAAAYIDSDYYSAQILSDAIDDVDFSEELFAKILSASNNIESDYYQAQVLEDALDIPNLTDNALSQIIENTKGIGSDYYQAQVLSTTMETPGLSKKSLEKVTAAVMDISSDYYMAEVLEKMIDNRLDDNVIQSLITSIDRNMSSDHYKASVLSELVQEQQLTAASMQKLADAIGNMNSDSYAAEIIEDAADMRDINKQVLISLLDACSRIDSDYYCAEALESLASHVRDGDADIKDAYRRAAKNIGSTHYYGQALKAID